MSLENKSIKDVFAMKCSRIISIIAINVCLLSCLSGCSKDAASSNNQNNISENSILSKSINDNKNQDKEKDSITSDKSDTKITDDVIREQAQVKELINKIFETAKSGSIINSRFSVKINSITDVEESFGPSKETDYVESAKGSYANYPDNNVVFGFNKKSLIFEARSFDPSLKSISLANLKSTLGQPDHYVKTEAEQIIGYVVNDDFKLLLVFDQGYDENTLYLKHYSVFYPKGTVNTIAGDKGRDW